MTLKIISPEKVLFNGNVKQVDLPGTMGGFTILDRHAPLISSLTKGDIVYVPEDSGEKRLAIGGGIVEVRDNKIVVCIN